MSTGTGKGISVELRKTLLHFNGGLFAGDTVLGYEGEPQPVTWAMGLASSDLPGLPDEVREKARSGGSAERRQLPEGGGIAALYRDAATSDAGVITVWDQRSLKTDMVTGRGVPDQTKRVPDG